MGLFGFISDVFKVVISPVTATIKVVEGIVTGDPKKIVKGLTSPIPELTKAVTSGIGLVAPSLGLGAGLPPMQGLAGVPAFQQVRLPVGQGTTVGSGVPIGRQGISGGTAAFSSFTPQTLTGGNPAWRFLGLSSVRSREREVFSVRSQGRWVQSGHSVRLLR